MTDAPDMISRADADAALQKLADRSPNEDWQVAIIAAVEAIRALRGVLSQPSEKVGAGDGNTYIVREPAAIIAAALSDDSYALLAGQAYSYIGKNWKPVLARDLEDDRDALRAQLADANAHADRLADEIKDLRAAAVRLQKDWKDDEGWAKVTAFAVTYGEDDCPALAAHQARKGV